MHIQNSQGIVKTFGNTSGRQIFWLVTILVAVSSCETIQSQSGLQAEQGGITKGPMLIRVEQNRAAVMWETNSQEVCKVYYGKEGKPERYIESKGEKVQYNVKDEKRTVFIHKVWLEGLEAGTVHSYQIMGNGVKSEVYGFRTAPANSDRVRFIVYGDSRTRPKFHQKLVKLMIAKKVDFVVNGGDFVTSGERYEQWGPQFFKPLSGLIETMPFYAVKGNHEGESGNYEKLLIPAGETNNFGFDYGPLHYFCADNAIKGGEPNKILELITNDIKNSKARWKFVSYHRPSLNFGHHWSAWGYPEALARFAEAGVDFVITGHSHQYERFRPIAPAKEGGLTSPAVAGPAFVATPAEKAYAKAGSYVTYITSGGGGVITTGIQSCEYHVKTSATHHFCLFEINGDKLTMDTIDIEGRIIDHLEVTKSDGLLNKEYIEKAVPMEEIGRYQKANLHREK